MSSFTSDGGMRTETDPIAVPSHDAPREVEDRRLDTSGEQNPLYDRMARELYVAVISDILDRLGYRNQVMQAAIRPVDPGSRQVLVGRAATIQCTPQYEVPVEPYTG